MRIEFQKTENNELKGWELIAETKEEGLQLGNIRDAIFFGLKDLGTYPKYAGRRDFKDTGDTVIVEALKWIIPKHQ